MLRAFSRQWDRTANGGRMPMSCCALAAWPRSSNEAASRHGRGGGTSARSSSGRPSSSLPVRAHATRNGPKLFTCLKRQKAKATRRPSAHWLTNGYASSSDAGRLIKNTMKPDIWNVCEREDPSWSRSQAQPRKRTLQLDTSLFDVVVSFHAGWRFNFKQRQL